MKNKIIIFLVLASFSGFGQIVRTLPNVTNTADSMKPVSTYQKTALNLKANSLNAVFTGNVGIGITTPFSTFHVKLGTNQNVVFFPNLNGAESGTPGIISVNDVNSAFTPLGFYASKYNFGGGNLIVGSNTDNGNKLQITGNVSIIGNSSINGNLGVAGTGLAITGSSSAMAAITFFDSQAGGNTWYSGPGIGTGQITGFSVVYNATTIGNIIYAKNDGKVGFGTVTPTSTLHNNGSESRQITTISAAATLGDTYYVVANSATTYLITLPAVASCIGRTYAIKTLTGNKTITAFLNSTGISTTTLTAGTVIYIASDGTNWQQF